jgi:hypothetical protein
MKGGVLTFRLWNDHSKGTPQTANQLNIKTGKIALTERLVTADSDRAEFFTDYPNEWGPAGAKAVEVNVPAGVALVEFDTAGSATGVELSDFVSRSN